VISGVTKGLPSRSEPALVELWDLDVLVVLALDRVLEFLVDLVDHVEQDVLEVPLDVERLVGDLGAAVADLRCLPEARDLGREVVLDTRFLAVGEADLVERFEVVGDRSQFRLDGLAAGLGRVGGERRFDEHVVQHLLDGLGVRAPCREFLDGVADAVFERAVPTPLAGLSDALAFLGEVDQFEVGSEGTRDDILHRR